MISELMLRNSANGSLKANNDSSKCLALNASSHLAWN